MLMLFWIEVIFYEFESDIEVKVFFVIWMLWMLVNGRDICKK